MDVPRHFHVVFAEVFAKPPKCLYVAGPRYIKRISTKRKGKNCILIVPWGRLYKTLHYYLTARFVVIVTLK
jgi:hypothetical protein